MWPQRPYATHGVANQVLYSLYRASLLQEAISLCTMGVWLSTSAALDIKALSLIWSAKTSNFPFPLLTWPPKASVVGVVEAPISDQWDLGRSWVFAVLSQPSGLQSWGKKELPCSLCPKPHKETLCSSVTQRMLLLGNCFLIYAFHIIPVTLTFGIKTQDGVNKPFS